MVQVGVKMFGVERAQRLVAELPKRVLNAVDKTNGQFMEIVQISAKLRAPKFTGQLAESIVVKKRDDKWTLTVDSPYGWFQEYGFTPNFLPADMPVEGGYRIGDWMAAKGMSGFGFIPSGDAQPFVAPAFEEALALLPLMLAQSVKDATRGDK